MSELPTEFRGCFWEEPGWEFSGPGVIYYPPRFRRYAEGGNSGALDDAVEDIAFGIGEGDEPDDGGLEDECERMGWSLRGFARRKRAWHVVFRVTWMTDEDGRPMLDDVQRTETYGPPPVDAHAPALPGTEGMGE